MAVATLTSKGQVTIPKEVRDVLKLQAGDKVEFVLSDEPAALLKPVTKRVDEVFGRLQKPGRKPVTVERMKEGIRRKLRTDWL
jgi:antitoxin PrlF